MDPLPLDVVSHLLSFLSNGDVASLSLTCQSLCALVNSMPRIWRRLLVHTTWYGPYSHLWYKPYNAFRAHGVHIQRITFGAYGEYPCYTYLSALDMLTIARMCTSLTHLHIWLPITNVLASTKELNTLLATSTTLTSLTYPYKAFTLQCEQWTPWHHRLTHLHLHGPAPPLQRLRPCIIQRLHPATLTSLHLQDVLNLDLDYLMRYLHNVHTLSITGCQSHREWESSQSLWHRILPRLRRLHIYASRKVVHSMRPFVSFLRTFPTRLPLCSLGGDVTDVGFMQLVATLTCLQCTQERRGNHLILTRCTASVSSVHVPQLAGLTELHVRHEGGQ